MGKVLKGEDDFLHVSDFYLFTGNNMTVIFQRHRHGKSTVQHVEKAVEIVRRVCEHYSFKIKRQ
jgi:hypothetical protein